MKIIFFLFVLLSFEIFAETKLQDCKLENNKIISSLTGNLRKQLSLPITIVPGNL